MKSLVKKLKEHYKVILMILSRVIYIIRPVCLFRAAKMGVWVPTILRRSLARLRATGFATLGLRDIFALLTC